MDIPAEPFEVPSGRVARGRVVAPTSKSHAIRALICAALADGTSTLHGLSRCDADDVQRTVLALRKLGVEFDGERVTGMGSVVGGLGATLDLGGSATAFRFLAAVAALAAGPVTLTGDATLRRRPMDATVLSLRALGASVKAACSGDSMVPPLVVENLGRSFDEVEVDVSSSSHPLSALLLVGPVLPRGITVRPSGRVASASYVELTVQTMAQFGVLVERHDDRYQVRSGGYEPAESAIDADWSSAAFLMAAAAVCGDAAFGGLRADTLQADARILDILRHFGAELLRRPNPQEFEFCVRAVDRRPLDVDLKDAPDLAPLVGALGCVASGTTRVRGAAHLRIKESDRIAAVVAAARALGCEARETPDGFEIDGPAKHSGLIETRHDHRIAMAFAVAGLAIPGVVIDDTRCVAKSYPGFWRDLVTLIGG
jgi:3-phosphoshikimate 1-carboxyvinyltransferase